MFSHILRVKKKIYLLCAFMFALQVLANCIGDVGGEACSKIMTVEGIVTDSITLQPLSGVNVFNVLVRDQDIVQDTTGEDGKYSFRQHSLGGFANETVRFEKTGYQAAYAERLSEEEAGIGRCGEYTITRNVAMVPL